MYKSVHSGFLDIAAPPKTASGGLPYGIGGSYARPRCKWRREMPTIEGYKFIYVAENGRTMVFITTEPTKEKAKAYFKAKYGNAQILSWRPLGVDALRNEGIGGDESKEY